MMSQVGEQNWGNLGCSARRRTETAPVQSFRQRVLTLKSGRPAAEI